MRRVILSLCACFALSACGGTDESGRNTVSTNNASPPAQTVSPSATQATVGALPAEVVRVRGGAPVELSAGGKAEASVVLDIAEGFHVNANPPTLEYLRPTALSVTPERGVTAGEPAYPTPLKKKFSFERVPLAVYEKQVTIKVPLSAAADAPKGEARLRATVSVQPCDDTACYPPRKIETVIPFVVK